MNLQNFVEKRLTRGVVSFEYRPRPARRWFALAIVVAGFLALLLSGCVIRVVGNSPEEIKHRQGK